MTLAAVSVEVSARRVTVRGDRNACRYTAVNKTAFCSVLNSRRGIAKTLFNKIKNNPAYKKFIKKNVIKKKKRKLFFQKVKIK